MDRSQLQDDLAEFAGLAPVRSQSGHAESVRAQPSRWPNRVLPVVHVPPELEPNVPQCLDPGVIHPRWTQRQRHQRLLDGLDDGRSNGWCTRSARNHPELVPAAVPRLEKPGEAVAAADTRRETRLLAPVPAEGQGTTAAASAEPQPPAAKIRPSSDAGDPIIHQGGHLRDCTLCK